MIEDEASRMLCTLQDCLLGLIQLRSTIRLDTVGEVTQLRNDKNYSFKFLKGNSSLLYQDSHSYGLQTLPNLPDRYSEVNYASCNKIEACKSAPTTRVCALLSQTCYIDTREQMR